MRSIAVLLAGLLLAAAAYYLAMPRAERGRIVQVTPTVAEPVTDGDERAADVPVQAEVRDARSSRVDRTRASGAIRPVAVPDPAPAATPAAVAARPSAVPLPSDLVVPVQGVAPSSLSPTFDDDRGEGRVHEALDIMAPAGTPVLAVADGHVEKLFDSDRGGLTMYQFEPTGRYAYYYAHLERYAPGLEEGAALRQGEVIGYVGSTGNADPAAPHLHFAIFLLGPEKRWWEGTPIDPWPLLSGRAP
ncbi:M23 family metallopeptidase [Luteimonas sp. Sa2BVA3]|uniref:M23 family metallopeptidase n=1 Tax=Luteimonas colneyensis TaxID=2762230 RepID=A0ABR8ULE5_9GAMM|nr:M23 family metallopeptidase [Luteimonas colneyensis]MBD7988836.1 M23 family metallopeptidase [Luteimonas colneyensis]